MKIDRMISMVMLLLQRDIISASELAETFEVSTRTIYRDVEAINQAGIPIVSYRAPLPPFYRHRFVLLDIT